MEIQIKLESKLLERDFSVCDREQIIAQSRDIAKFYALIENSISVVSNLQDNCSYIYTSPLAQRLGVYDNVGEIVIDSIWEQELYDRVHPDDLTARHNLELQLHSLIRESEESTALGYRTHSHIRIKDNSGEYIPITHRTQFLSCDSNGTPWLAICLYNYAFTSAMTQGFTAHIHNSVTGNNIPYNASTALDTLTRREIQILKLIDNGLRSKEISDRLSISINTVNRHRQNILEKLRVGSSIEAIKVVNLGAQ